LWSFHAGSAGARHTPVPEISKVSWRVRSTAQRPLSRLPSPNRCLLNQICESQRNGFRGPPGFSQNTNALVERIKIGRPSALPRPAPRSRPGQERCIESLLAGSGPINDGNAKRLQALANSGEDFPDTVEAGVALLARFQERCGVSFGAPSRARSHCPPPPQDRRWAQCSRARALAPRKKPSSPSGRQLSQGVTLKSPSMDGPPMGAELRIRA